MVIINFAAAPLHVISPRGEFRYFNPDWGFSNQRLVISGKVVWKSYTSLYMGENLNWRGLSTWPEDKEHWLHQEGPPLIETGTEIKILSCALEIGLKDFK